MAPITPPTIHVCVRFDSLKNTFNDLVTASSTLSVFKSSVMESYVGFTLSLIKPVLYLNKVKMNIFQDFCWCRY